jgi:hypothetical protein
MKGDGAKQKRPGAGGEPYRAAAEGRVDSQSRDPQEFDNDR